MAVKARRSVGSASHTATASSVAPGCPCPGLACVQWWRVADAASQPARTAAVRSTDHSARAQSVTPHHMGSPRCVVSSRMSCAKSGGGSRPVASRAPG